MQQLPTLTFISLLLFAHPKKIIFKMAQSALVVVMQSRKLSNVHDRRCRDLQLLQFVSAQPAAFGKVEASSDFTHFLLISFWEFETVGNRKIKWMHSGTAKWGHWQWATDVTEFTTSQDNERLHLWRPGHGFSIIRTNWSWKPKKLKRQKQTWAD